MHNRQCLSKALALLLCPFLMAGGLAFGASLKLWTQGRTPVLALKDMRGQSRSLDDFRGKVVIVNFWATWCEPCIEEMPSLQSYLDRSDKEGIVVVGVNLGEAEARIKSFTDKTGTSFPILLDRDGVAKKNWKVSGVPATFVVDPAGRVRYWYTGVLDFSDAMLTAPIERLIQQKKKKS